MRVVLEPVSGTAKGNLGRAKLEIERVLAFRGSVTSVKTIEDRIIVEFEINPAWDLPMSEKVELLKQWIPAKVRTILKVHRVSSEDEVS